MQRIEQGAGCDVQVSERGNVLFVSCITILDVECWWLHPLYFVKVCRCDCETHQECCLPRWQAPTCKRGNRELNGAGLWRRGQCSFCLSHPQRHCRTTRSPKQVTGESQVFYSLHMNDDLFGVKRRKLFRQTPPSNVHGHQLRQMGCQIWGAARPAADRHSLTVCDLNLVFGWLGSELQTTVGLQMFDGVGMLRGGFGVQRFWRLLLTVLANVPRKPWLERPHFLCARPRADECSLSVLYLNLLLDLFLLITQRP